MSRLHPIPYGAGIILVPDYFVPPTPKHDGRVVRPARRGPSQFSKGLRHG